MMLIIQKSVFSPLVDKSEDKDPHKSKVNISAQNLSNYRKCNNFFCDENLQQK